MSRLNEFEKLMDEIERCSRCFEAEPQDTPKFFDRRWFVKSDIALVGLAPSIHRLTPKLILARNVEPYIDALLREIGRTRENVYMTNLIKCTIPHVKTGYPGMCKEFLMKELEIVGPRFVILLGRTVVDTVLDQGIYHLSGAVVNQHNRIYFTCYHPSAVCRGTISQGTFMRIVKDIARAFAIVTGHPEIAVPISLAGNVSQFKSVLDREIKASYPRRPKYPCSRGYRSRRRRRSLTDRLLEGY